MNPTTSPGRKHDSSKRDTRPRLATGRDTVARGGTDVDEPPSSLWMDGVEEADVVAVLFGGRKGEGVEEEVEEVEEVEEKSRRRTRVGQGGKTTI